MEADHKSAAHVAAVWRETYPSGSTQSNMGAAYQEALAALQDVCADLREYTKKIGGCVSLERARAILIAAGR